jgi:molecular chaperone GrpE
VSSKFFNIKIKKVAEIEKNDKNINPENIDLAQPIGLTIKAVIINEKNEVLILKRSDREITNKNKFDLPGGHLNKDETIQEALKREILEETGLDDIEIGNIIKVSEYPKKSRLFNKIKALRFLVYYRSGDVALNGKEHSEYFWLPIDEAIKKFNEKDGFEREKKQTLMEAKKYLAMKEAEDRWRRALADLENYKKRSAKEREEFIKYCLEDLVLELLPVLDNFEMAVEHVPEKDKDENWMTGILHIRNQLENVLKDKGVEKIQVNRGDKLNEEIHNIVSGENKKGKVKRVLKSGYRLNGKIIRPASIISE